MAFSPLLQMRLVDDLLSYPPAKRHIRRVEGEGDLVVRFVLPLEHCPRVNAFREWDEWKMGKCKKAALELMRVQLLLQRRSIKTGLPLAGRPMVRLVRFSSVETDRDASWTKIPVDRLLPSRLVKRQGRMKLIEGLGLIADDNQEDIDLQFWTEPAPRGRGCVLVEVWTGSPE